MTYRVETVRSRVKKQLKHIPKTELKRIATDVKALGENPLPPGAVQLEKNVYRIRVGDYRIIYKIFEEEKLVLIGRVARRNEDTYKRVRDLF
ncbi:MAG: type II toxin-antitoxin system RelE/ParE family toxin [Chloroflexi bacterium]|nr:type II toxin-antitoxin system RelE/ParE family toxin [Chloroflexota bacterium]